MRQKKGSGFRYDTIGALEAPEGFDTLISASVDVGGRPVTLWSTPASAEDLRRYDVSAGGARFPRTRTTTRQTVALATHGDALTPFDVVEVDDVLPAFPEVQRLPGGDYLVVGARCAWRPEGPEKNAFVIGLDGETKRQGTLGDGIEHVLVDGSGDIWVGYFDEGISGNFGWGHPGPDPLGESGLVTWSAEFAMKWSFPTSAGASIWDCYALNVTDGRVLACTYTDFPVIDIREGDVEVRVTAGVSGARGVLVDGDQVAILGSYKDSSSVLTGPVNDRTRLKRTSLGVGRTGRKPRGRLVCRDSVAHLFEERDWFRFDFAAAGS